MPGLRSLRNRLAVIFALIILGAIGTIYLSVTPRLQASLTKQRLDGVVTRSRQYAPAVADLLQSAVEAGRSASPRKRAEIVKAARDRKVRRFAEQTATETLVLAVQKPGPFGVTDSTPDGGVDYGDVQGVARQALRTRRLARTTLTTANGRQAVVASPILEGEGKKQTVPWIVVFADSLSDVQDNVALIRRQVLISGAIALVIAVLAGYLVARALSARVKRLERAARKVASGDFSQPIRADSVDELGRLAAAFDDMQAQLARLDRARKQFIAAASHELRTPIFSLGGFL